MKLTTILMCIIGATTIAFMAARATEWPCCSANPDGHAAERMTLELRIDSLEKRVEKLEHRK